MPLVKLLRVIAILVSVRFAQRMILGRALKFFLLSGTGSINSDVKISARFDV